MTLNTIPAGPAVALFVNANERMSRKAAIFVKTDTLPSRRDRESAILQTAGTALKPERQSRLKSLCWANHITPQKETGLAGWVSPLHI